MSEEFVIGIDSSTQSTKSIAWDKNGNALGEGRAIIPMQELSGGRREQSPDDWWAACVKSIRELGQSVDLSKTRGVAISNQRETIGFMGADGKPVRPAMVWLDERSVSMVGEFSEAVGRDRIREITGKPPDITPAVYRLAWMQKHEPENLKKISKFVDVNAYHVWRMTGEYKGSWTSCDPSGVFDIRKKQWSNEILQPLGLSAEQFVEGFSPGTKLGEMLPDVARELGLPSGTSVFAAGGDGQCAGLGANAARDGVVYLNLGTAQIVGAWSDSARTEGLNWRTMTSPTGEGYFLEGCIRAGTFFVDWFIRRFVDPELKASTFQELENAGANLPVGSHGLVVAPYLSGAMNPYWKPDAKAAFFGLDASHDAPALYRALLESLTGDAARTTIEMRKSGLPLRKVVAMGGGANSSLWRKMLADACGLPIVVSQSIESSSLGAAMSAAVGLGWYSNFEEAAEAMSRESITQEPDPSAREQWDELLAEQDRVNRFVCA